MPTSTRRDPVLDAERKRFSDPEAEKAVVAGILLEGDRFPDIAYIQPSHFYTLTYADIWRACIELHKAGASIDVVTVADQLKRIGAAEPGEGWRPLLNGLQAQSEYTFNLEGHARIVADMAARRSLVERAANMEVPITPPVPEASRNVRVWCADEALATPPPVEWVVKGLVSRGSLCVLYGEPGSKKTYAMIDLAVCVATGREWLQYDTTQRRVLFVDEESGERRLKERMRQSLAGHLVGTCPGLSCISLAQIMLDEPAGMGILSEAIRLAQAELVIIDALADVMSGDENAKKDVQPVMTSLRRVAEESGAAIILIHHSNKIGGYRGSSAIKASPDLMVHVTSEPGSAYIHFKTEKNRDGLADHWDAKAVWVNGGDTPKQFYLQATERSQGQEGAGSNRARVLAFLREAGECSLKEIQEGLKLDVGEHAVKRAFDGLRELGVIQRADGGGPGAVGRYTVIELGDGLDSK